VKLHAAYDYITLVTVQLNDSDPLDSDSYSVNSTTNILTLEFASQLIVGETYVLQIDFEGTLYTSSGSKFVIYAFFAIFFIFLLIFRWSVQSFVHRFR